MLAKLARFATAHARQVLVVTLLLVVAAAAYGSSAVAHLSSGGFTDSTSPSTRADALLSSRFREGDPNLVFLLQAPGGAQSPPAVAVGRGLARQLAQQRYVTGVQSYWTVPAADRAGFVSRDGKDVGGTAIVGALAILRLLTMFVPVSVYALNLTTAMGLGLGIDYSLFILSRYREEVAAGRFGPEAVMAAVRSAGRTVLFSSLTVGLSLAAMMVFPFYFLRSFAYAGTAVVAVAAAGATVVLPALITLLGRRVNSWDVRPRLRRTFGLAKRGEGEREAGFWRRVAVAVMRRPVVFGLAVLAVLLLLGTPFLSVRFGLPDDRVLPASASAHQVGNVLRSDFSQDAANAVTIVLPETGSTSTRQLEGYAQRLSLLGGATEVISPAGTYVSGTRKADLSTPEVGRSAYLVVQNDVNPNSAAGQRLVKAVRALPAPAEALSTGPAARNLDSLNALGGMLPIALALIAASTVVVLFLFTRSVLVPLKALVLNALSLSATFGAMVWVFQDGHLASILGGVGATGYLNASMPVLMFCIAFGLSMDYEVFLLSRIKEAWDISDHSAAANTAAVASGLERTGRIVTAAAALIAIVFIAIGTSQISFIKLFGVGMALAVLMDATLVRGVLVPSFMRLAGRANWWAPRWLSFLALSEDGARGPAPEFELPPA